MQSTDWQSPSTIDFMFMPFKLGYTFSIIDIGHSLFTNRQTILSLIYMNEYTFAKFRIRNECLNTCIQIYIYIGTHAHTKCTKIYLFSMKGYKKFEIFNSRHKLNVVWTSAFTFASSIQSPTIIISFVVELWRRWLKFCASITNFVEIQQTFG